MRGEKRILLKFIPIIGLILRLLPSPFYAHPWDMYIWIKSGELGLHELNIYYFDNPTEYPWGFYAYPPMWLYWLILAVKLGNIAGNLYLKIFLIKLPIIIADTVAAIVLYRLAGRLGFDEKRSLVIMLLWVFNPVAYFMSSIWGMFDSIAALFALLGMYYTLNGKYVRAGTALGIGAAVKIIPALIMLPALAYLIKERKMTIKDFIIKMFAPFLSSFLIISAPFLSSPLQYFKVILQHTKSVGGFTYWAGLSTLINLSDFWFVPFLAFGVIMAVIVKKMYSGELGFIWACALIITSLFATSPKVNIQYLNFLIPLLLLSKEFWEEARVKRNFCLLMAAAVIWLASSWITSSGYSAQRIGQLYITESYELSPAYTLMIVAGIFGGTRFIALLMDYLSLKRFDTAYISKWNITIYLLTILIGLAFVFPSPAGVVIPYADTRIGIPESPDSAFIPKSEESVDQFLKHYNVTHVVIALSPDFVNTYGGYVPDRDVTVYFKFRIQDERWTQRDLFLLVKSLQSRGVKVLLGIYLKARDPVYRYSIQGFSTDWIKRHPNLLGQGNVLLFNSTINLPGHKVPYSEYFSERVKKIVDDFGFDGIYLMDWDDWEIKGDRLGHILPLIRALREKITKPIYIEGPYHLSDVDSVLTLLNEADLVVLRTFSWTEQLYYTASSNSLPISYGKQLIEVLESTPVDQRERVIFSVHTFSFVEGWLTPAIELQLEVNAFYEMGLRRGYAIYYADRYTPYKITIKCE